jgi:hypothetical protein
MHDLDDDVEDIDDDVLEVEPEPLEEEEAPANGFHAFLRHASLHNLLQLESLSRTTGVFLVVSGGSRGYLHLANGELVHAETADAHGGALSGEAAAAEILSWEDGEFKSCSRTLTPLRTVHSSVPALLLRLAQASDEAAQFSRGQSSRGQPSRVARRPLDQEAPTETYLPPALPPGAHSPSSVPPPPSSGSVASSSAAGAAALEAAGVLPSGASPSGSALPSVPPPSAAPAPSVRVDRANSVAEVVISAAGEVVHSRGAATEEFAARVAYAARLAELIGRAIRSGTPRALELRGKTTQTSVQWQGDGNFSASMELVQPARR